MRFFIFLILIISTQLTVATAQEQQQITLKEFIERGIERSGLVQYERGAVSLAENRIGQARSSRILPRVDLNTNHGLIPGVVSQTGLPKGQYYLDPNLENNWEDWAIFTRAEISALQPIYSWGAINKAIRAAEAGAIAAEQSFNAKQDEVALQLYELYYSYLLAIEIERILDDAERTINRIGDTLKEMQDEMDPDLKERDVFQYDIFKTEFQIQKTQVAQSKDVVNRIWNYILGSNNYAPSEAFLDPVKYDLLSFDEFHEYALQNRPEIKGVNAGIDALRNVADATRAQNYPLFYLGLTASYANTPNRPRQTNPFIINNTNFASAGIGFGIRQNLNFSAMRTQNERAEIEFKRGTDLRNALTDGIMLELNEKYSEAVVAETKVTQLEEALRITREWVRHEQLNYDYGFGDVEDLLDASRKELELRVQVKQSVYELNKKIAALYKSAGLPVTELGHN